MKNSLAAVFPLMLVQGCAAVFRIGVGLVNHDAQEHIIGYRSGFDPDRQVMRSLGIVYAGAIQLVQ